MGWNMRELRLKGSSLTPKWSLSDIAFAFGPWSVPRRLAFLISVSGSASPLQFLAGYSLYLLVYCLSSWVCEKHVGAIAPDTRQSYEIKLIYFSYVGCVVFTIS